MQRGQEKLRGSYTSSYGNIIVLILLLFDLGRLGGHDGPVCLRPNTCLGLPRVATEVTSLFWSLLLLPETKHVHQTTGQGILQGELSTGGCNGCLTCFCSPDYLDHERTYKYLYRLVSLILWLTYVLIEVMLKILKLDALKNGLYVDGICINKPIENNWSQNDGFVEL